MLKEEFDAEFEEERKELAELEHSEPLPTIEEEEELEEKEVIVCTCKIDPRFCELHQLEDDEDEIYD